MGLFKRKKKKQEPVVEYEELSVDLDADCSYLVNEFQAFSVRTPEEVKQYVEESCEQIAEATKRLDRNKVEYQVVSSYLKDIQIIEDIPEVNKKQLYEIGKKVLVLQQDKEDYRNAQSKISHQQFANIESCENEIASILKAMDEDEKYCHMIKKDMQILNGEKTSIAIEKHDLTDRIDAIGKLGKILLLSSISILGILLVSSLVFELDIMYLLYGTVFAAIIGTMVLYYLHSNAQRKLAMNAAKLNKTIMLMNKVKLKYVNVVSRLDYYYEKHQVKSAKELNQLWGMYLQHKKEKEIYSKTSYKLYEYREDLAHELSHYHLYDAGIWVTQVNALMNKSEMNELHFNLDQRRKRLKSSIEIDMQLLEKTKSRILDLIKLDKTNAKDILEIVNNYELNL